ncbi:helix-turn-helix transcriptional regulator [Tistrella mobilis]|uniref:helix-turn-helix domain-containing protein n=1 Tax=Tistrella mobilis TaxID=171437 RepID=UPI00355786E4
MVSFAALLQKYFTSRRLPVGGIMNRIIGREVVVSRRRETSATERLQALPRLSRRERECLEWAARGKTNLDIAVILGISGHTVDFHMRGAMNKLGVSNRIVAVVMAMRAEAIDP